jgi:hypothetical protein
MTKHAQRPKLPFGLLAREARSGPRWLALAVAAVVLTAGFVSFAVIRAGARTSGASEQSYAAAVASGDAASSAAAQGAARSSAVAASAAAASSASAAASAAAVSAAAAAKAAKVNALTALAAGDSASAVSVAALNLTTGASYSWGATGGMNTGSIVKLYILETLLVQKQNSGGLTSYQQQTATTMIENSNNDSAETLFEAIGGRDALIAANPTLGLTNTTPGPGDYWGLTQTSAPDYVTLLHNLVATTGSPLTAASQAYVLGLMRNVESDQRWGVGVTADAGTDFANKNGWLNVDDDNGLWLVNSTGVVTIKGQTVLMAVLTQHNSDFQTGINFVQSLAQALAPIVTS